MFWSFWSWFWSFILIFSDPDFAPLLLFLQTERDMNFPSLIDF